MIAKDNSMSKNIFDTWQLALLMTPYLLGAFITFSAQLYIHPNNIQFHVILCINISFCFVILSLSKDF